MTDADRIEAIARICHETNRAYCVVKGDLSQLLWDEAPGWQRESAVAGVRFALEHPEATPEDQHEEWRAKKAAEGWHYGPVKDVGCLTHPCMVAYADLPEVQRKKDDLFLAIVRALA